MVAKALAPANTLAVRLPAGDRMTGGGLFDTAPLAWRANGARMLACRCGQDVVIAGEYQAPGNC